LVTTSGGRRELEQEGRPRLDRLLLPGSLEVGEGGVTAAEAETGSGLTVRTLPREETTQGDQGGDNKTTQGGEAE